MITWQPSATLAALHLRAQIIFRIRQFFTERGLLEVETPLLSHATVTALHLHSFKTNYHTDNKLQNSVLYLQTSPEYCMKRLLAAGSGPIFQICKAFRNNGEHGRIHNPEFTLLEWYRPGFNHHDLMNEMDDLLQFILTTSSADRISYAEIFKSHFAIDPHTATALQLSEIAKKAGLEVATNFSSDNKDDWLNFLMTHIIEPKLGQQRPLFIYDYPCSQAALAKIRPGVPSVAERFEVYYQGIELANGFHELNDAEEQRQRFEDDLMLRKKNNYPTLPLDENLLAALRFGLPNCAGVALGIDRLILLAANKTNIADVISFTFAQA